MPKENQETKERDPNLDLENEDSEEGEELSEEELAKYLSGEGEEKDMEEGEGEGEGEEKKKEPESKEGESKGEGEEGEEGEGEPAPEKTTEELLRDQIAESKRAFAQMQTEMKRLEQKVSQRDDLLKEHGLLEDESPEDQEKHRAALRARQEDLAQLEEMIRLNPKFSDYDQVVTTTNEEELISHLAREVHQAEGGEYSMSECEQAVRDSIEGLTNPFRFKYEAIKTFQEGKAKPETKDKETPEDSKEEKDKGKSKLPETKQQTPKPVSAPGSVQSVGGGPKGGTYTSERLDNMSSEELEKVPDDVRERWLGGELD